MYRSIGIQAYDKHITQVPGPGEIVDMAFVEDIKTPVGKYNLFVLESPHGNSLQEHFPAIYLSFGDFKRCH
jgi:hypothetical protein